MDSAAGDALLSALSAMPTVPFLRGPLPYPLVSGSDLLSRQICWLIFLASLVILRLVLLSREDRLLLYIHLHNGFHSPVELLWRLL